MTPLADEDIELRKVLMRAADAAPPPPDFDHILAAPAGEPRRPRWVRPALAVAAIAAVALTVAVISTDRIGDPVAEVATDESAVTPTPAPSSSPVVVSTPSPQPVPAEPLIGWEALVPTFVPIPDALAWVDQPQAGPPGLTRCSDSRLVDSPYANPPNTGVVVDYCMADGVVLKLVSEAPWSTDADQEIDRIRGTAVTKRIEGDRQFVLIDGWFGFDAPTEVDTDILIAMLSTTRELDPRVENPAVGNTIDLSPLVADATLFESALAVGFPNASVSVDPGGPHEQRRGDEVITVQDPPSARIDLGVGGSVELTARLQPARGYSGNLRIENHNGIDYFVLRDPAVAQRENDRRSQVLFACGGLNFNLFTPDAATDTIGLDLARRVTATLGCNDVPISEWETATGLQIQCQPLPPNWLSGRYCQSQELPDGSRLFVQVGYSRGPGFATGDHSDVNPAADVFLDGPQGDGSSRYSVPVEIVEADPNRTTITYDDEAGHVVISEEGGLEVRLPICSRIADGDPLGELCPE